MVDDVGQRVDPTGDPALLLESAGNRDVLFHRVARGDPAPLRSLKRTFRSRRAVDGEYDINDEGRLIALRILMLKARRQWVD